MYFHRLILDQQWNILSFTGDMNLMKKTGMMTFSAAFVSATCQGGRGRKSVFPCLSHRGRTCSALRLQRHDSVLLAPIRCLLWGTLPLHVCAAAGHEGSSGRPLTPQAARSLPLCVSLPHHGINNRWHIFKKDVHFISFVLHGSSEVNSTEAGNSCPAVCLLTPGSLPNMPFMSLLVTWLAD